MKFLSLLHFIDKETCSERFSNFSGVNAVRFMLLSLGKWNIHDLSWL